MPHDPPVSTVLTTYVLSGFVIFNTAIPPLFAIYAKSKNTERAIIKLGPMFSVNKAFKLRESKKVTP